MAIVDDIRKDRRTQNVLAQTNTKTVSTPPTATGLVGDQLPAEVFTVDDFDSVRNQVHLEEKNFQLLEALNTMGQITNMQSQSGPIPATMKGEVVSLSAGVNGSFFTPGENEVWQVLDLAFNKGSGTGTGNYFVVYVDEDNSDLEIPIVDSLSNAETAVQFNDWPGSPVYHTRRVQVKARYTVNSGSISSVDMRACFIRVR